MFQPYLKIWEWELIFGRAVKAISSPGVRSPWEGSNIFRKFSTYWCKKVTWGKKGSKIQEKLKTSFVDGPFNVHLNDLHYCYLVELEQENNYLTNTP